MAHWHGLAKLRMHSDLTLEIMDAVTISLGEKLRVFSQTTCPAFVTRELRREFNARVRRETKKPVPKRRQPAGGHGQGGDTHIIDQTTSNSEIVPVDAMAGQQQPSAVINDAGHDPSSARPNHRGRRHKTFNLNTYKLHSLGDYVTSIRKYGTTDSYSTEPVCEASYLFEYQTADWLFQGELEHRSPKARYTRTSRKHFIKQLTQIERRQARLRRIRARHHEAGKPANEAVATAPEAHHIIGKSQNYPQNIPLFLQKYAGDPAIKVKAMPSLKGSVALTCWSGFRAETQISHTSAY
jgi:hypothetical protein